MSTDSTERPPPHRMRRSTASRLLLFLPLLLAVGFWTLHGTAHAGEHAEEHAEHGECPLCLMHHGAGELPAVEETRLPIPPAALEPVLPKSDDLPTAPVSTAPPDPRGPPFAH